MLKKLALGIFALIGLILSFGSEGAYDTTFFTFNTDRPRITLSHMSWDDTIAATAVISTVLQDEGFEVDLIQLDPAFIYSSLATGDSDFSVSPWLPVTHGSYLEEYGDDLDVIGPHMDEARMAIVVPSYMEDVESIEDLTDQANQTITGIEPGAGLTQQIDQAIDTYGNLSNWEHQQSSTGAMLTELQLAYNNEEEIVFGGWTPHWKFIEYDLRILEDPENAFGSEEGIVTIARTGFQEDNPIAYEIIEKFNWGVDDIQEVMMLMQEGLSPAAAARQWVDENADLVSEWTEGINEDE